MKQFLVLLITASGLLAADATGTWSGTLKAPDHDGPAYLILTQQGETLTGSGGPNADEQHPISNGRVKDSNITFEIEHDEAVMKFSLKLDGDEIKGTVHREKDGETQTAQLEVKRVKASAENRLERSRPLMAAVADATGTWAGTLHAPDQDESAYMILTQNGDTLTGSVGPNVGEQHPISEGKVRDGNITFVIQPEVNVVLKFALKLDGDDIRGTSHPEKNESQTARLEFRRIKASAENQLGHSPQPVAAVH